MSFIWPIMLVSLVVIPLFVVLWVRMQRRRLLMAERYGTLGLVQMAKGGGLGLRRYLPATLFLIGLTLLSLAMARPQATVSLPRVEGTVILAFDVSGSMNAEDMKPNRMEAAKVAAKAFVDRQPDTVQIGVVSFSEAGFSVQAPTNDDAAILAAINRLTPQRGTSLGSGILASLQAIATAKRGEITRYYTNATPMPSPTPTPMPDGVYQPAIIVLLTDGENNVRPDPLVAAKAAKDRGVRIYTVGIGSATGTTLKVEGFNVFTQLDEATLKAIAQATNGEYFNAQNEEQLRKIYEGVGSQLVIKPERTEITSLFAGASLFVLLIGGLFSMLWFSRMP
jgi:Ca-activated chloride channel homolog